MPAPEHNRWSEWRESAREQGGAIRHQFTEWVKAAREEPALIWQTPPVRYATYVFVGLIAVFFIRFVVESIQPIPTKEMTPPLRTANFHVICTNDGCWHHFVIERRYKFRKFPVECPKCRRESGRKALRCNSPTCNGRMVATTIVEGRIQCVQCEAGLGSN